MIHMGAMVGGNLTQGRSRTLNWNPSFLTRFRNTQDRRDFITGGAAAGVSAAFGAPIGYGPSPPPRTMNRSLPDTLLSAVVCCS